MTRDFFEGMAYGAAIMLFVGLFLMAQWASEKAALTAPPIIFKSDKQPLRLRDAQTGFCWPRQGCEAA